MGPPCLGQRQASGSAPTPHIAPRGLFWTSARGHRNAVWLFIGVTTKPQVPYSGERRYQFFPSLHQPLLIRWCQGLQGCSLRPEGSQSGDAAEVPGPALHLERDTTDGRWVSLAFVRHLLRLASL